MMIIEHLAVVVAVALSCLLVGLMTAMFTMYIRLLLQGKGMILSWYYLRLLHLWDSYSDTKPILTSLLKPLGLCFWCYGSWVAVGAWAILFNQELYILCALLGTNWFFLGLLDSNENLKP